jgi:hypothetical protein
LGDVTQTFIYSFTQGKKQEEALKDLLSENPIPKGKSLEDLPPSDMEIHLRSFVSEIS